jgi:hypothetical protein
MPREKRENEIAGLCNPCSDKTIGISAGRAGLNSLEINDIIEEFV